MKPNDKAYAAARKVAYNLINKCFVFDLIKEAVDAAYAAQFQSEDYPGLVRELRMRPHRRGNETDAQSIERRQGEREKAADAIEAVLAERDNYKNWLDNYEKQFAAKVEELVTVRLERDALKAENESMKQSLPLWAHKQMAANSELIDRLRAERDALLARLAPVEDEELVKIAAKEMQSAELAYMPAAAIAAIRPHIEAAERARCAEALEITSDEIRLHAGEMTTQEMRSVLAVLAWRAAAIRSRK